MKPLMLGSDARGRPLTLDPDDRKTHTHVIGSSGSGKSKFLEHLMRQDIKNRQGFCLIDPHGSLYEAILEHCAHGVLDRDIIPLNLSAPASIIGFNPFQRAPSGDISVQVDRRINATMHAWGVTDADQTPTLARTLRLIYTVMIEHNLGLPQAAHLIDFAAHNVRGHLIEQLSTPLIQREWRELQQMKSREWREEILSAKNRLFKLLTSPTLGRVMGVPGRSVDLPAAIEEGKIVLVNLAPSDYLSHENARVFGALLVNEFFECAMRRGTGGPGPAPYYLYLDEFQSFVSPDIADMLDQVRKFGIFMVLAHQRFGQLDENIMDAVLTNCRIKAVFGGLPFESAKAMAQELFIGQLDPMKIKAAIYQTKFWPKYSRDQVYTTGTTTSAGTSRSTAHGTSSGTSQNSATGSFVGVGESVSYFEGGDWLNTSQPTGQSTKSSSSGFSSMTGSSSSLSESDSESFTESESRSESESVADIPIFIPVPFQELSSVQYFGIDEQLHQMTAALKEQFPRHCFIKIQGQETQPLLVPIIKDYPHLSEKNQRLYYDELLVQQKALPAGKVDELLQRQEEQLLSVTTGENPSLGDPPGEEKSGPKGPTRNLFDELARND